MLLAAQFERSSTGGAGEVDRRCFLRQRAERRVFARDESDGRQRERLGDRPCTIRGTAAGTRLLARHERPLACKARSLNAGELHVEASRAPTLAFPSLEAGQLVTEPLAKCFDLAPLERKSLAAAITAELEVQAIDAKPGVAVLAHPTELDCGPIRARHHAQGK